MFGMDQDAVGARFVIGLGAAQRRVDIESDYMGFEVPDRYIVGYGLDHGEAYRNLPYLTYVE